MKTGNYRHVSSLKLGGIEPTIKKGGTRPPPEANPMSRLLLLSEPAGSKRGGIGNAAMGGVFKSIYLA